jgi:hypothetical protein
VLTNYKGLEPYHYGKVKKLRPYNNKFRFRKGDIVVLYECSNLRDKPHNVEKLKSVLDSSEFPQYTIDILGDKYFTIYEIDQTK